MTLLLSKDTNQAKKLSRLLKEKKVRKIYHGIYTDDLNLSLEEIVIAHWMQLVAHIVSSGIVSFSTAMTVKPQAIGEKYIIFLTSTYTKTIELPGLIIKVQKGNREDFIEHILPNLARSNVPRMLLENLSNVRSYQNIKTMGITGVENYLAKELQLRKESSLNHIRDSARVISAKLGYTTEYKKLSQIISTLLTTNNTHTLHSDYAKSVVRKEPFDITRIQLFENLILFLKQYPFKKYLYQYNKMTFKNISFYESYFSNFIEGTEFLIDEAEDIVFKGDEIKNRHADSHDILSHFILSNDFSEMSITPNSPTEFLEILKERHAYLMHARPDKNPGLFKQKPNKAGGTHFVLPENTIGTLCQAFELYQLLNEGIEKALFMQFMVSEVHPFDDGNGRLSRIMMNAELVKTEQYKIIVPSVCRDNYLNGLRLASRDQHFHVYCRTMNQLSAYVNSVPWHDYSETRHKIESDGANLTPDEGLPFFNRVLRALDG